MSEHEKQKSVEKAKQSREEVQIKRPKIYSILTKEMQELLDSGVPIPGFPETHKMSRV